MSTHTPLVRPSSSWLVALRSLAGRFRRRLPSRATAARPSRLHVEALEGRALPAPVWAGFGQDPQHTAVSAVASQPLQTIRWQQILDQAPPSDGNDLLAHYGNPVVTQANTVIIPETLTSGGFQMEARDGTAGLLRWRQRTDYVAPSSSWALPFQPVLTPNSRLFFAGAGGTVYYMDNVDSVTPAAPVQVAFYGLANYQAAASTYNAAVFINTPLTSDADGNIYFGFQVTGTTPLGLQSGIARIAIDSAGHVTGTMVAAATAAGDASVTEVVNSSAPALSNDGGTLYVAVSGGGPGYLLALDSTTLATTGRVMLLDPSDGRAALLPDIGTASPLVGPDGDVYFGVLENPVLHNHDRGYLLHFSADLQITKTPGAFGWDDTPSIVPLSMVPTSVYLPAPGTTYLLMCKYNDYAGLGGSGDNQIAILDPNAPALDPVAQTVVMTVAESIAGPTPDSSGVGVREWCINSAAVDPATDSVLANSEDGKLYRWNLASNSFSDVVTLTGGVGEAYTPTSVGADGTVYAINNATLFAVGLPSDVGLAAVSDQTVTQGSQLQVSLSGNGPSGVTLTYSGVAVSPAYALSVRYGFYSDGSDHYNWGGRQEKWFEGAGGTWFFILPSGQLYKWDGSSQATGSLIDTFDATYYADPSLLYDAKAGDPAATVTASANVLTITPNARFIGSFDVRAVVSDGTFTATQFFTVTVTSNNHPPVLDQPSDATITKGQSYTVTLHATDADGDPITYGGSAVSQAYQLKQQYGFTFDGNDYYNYGGQQDKWFQGSGGAWFFILPSGKLYKWDGTAASATGTLIATMDVGYYADLSLLYNATQGATVSVSGTLLTVTPDAGFVGYFTVTATASDGMATDSKSFTLTVNPPSGTDHPPSLDQPSDASISRGQSYTVTLHATDPDGDPITYGGSAASQAYQLKQQYGFFFGGKDYFNYGGQQDKWFQGSGNAWFFILPSGQLYLWDGTAGQATGTLIATMDTSYYVDPSLLYNATPGATVSVSGNQLTVTPDPTFVGIITVTATASDGTLSDSKTFTLTVS
jgi:hypothetical protein